LTLCCSVVIMLYCYCVALLLFVLSYVLIVCTVPLPPGFNPIAVDKYIYLSKCPLNRWSVRWMDTCLRNVGRPLEAQVVACSRAVSEGCGVIRVRGRVLQLGVRWGRSWWRWILQLNLLRLRAKLTQTLSLTVSYSVMAVVITNCIEDSL